MHTKLSVPSLGLLLSIFSVSAGASINTVIESDTIHLPADDGISASILISKTKKCVLWVPGRVVNGEWVPGFCAIYASADSQSDGLAFGASVRADAERSEDSTTMISRAPPRCITIPGMSGGGSIGTFCFK